MRKILLILFVFLVCCSFQAMAEYHDHRNRNVDSLETVMAGWTADGISRAENPELKIIAKNLEDLMNGFLQTNSVKSEYYARMLLGIAKKQGWLYYEMVSSKIIGQHFWARDKYDSAAFYYNNAMLATDKMPVVEKGEIQNDGTYEQETKDDALSQMYGTLGNLYSMMDSIDVAMDYYEKAGVLFKKYNWYNSCSILYYNMGETVREINQNKRALEYYNESLEYSLLADDSLAVATAYKGLGSAYLDMGKTLKAMKCLVKANEYFADHEDEELQFRMESLDYTSQVLALQKKRRSIVILLCIAVLFLVSTTYLILKRLRSTTKEKEELSEILEETVEAIDTITPPEAKKEYKLKPRERQVLDLIGKGYTNAEVAEAMSLSPETIKWYKKKLFAMFEASNSAELVKIAKEEGLI